MEIVDKTSPRRIFHLNARHEVPNYQPGALNLTKSMKIKANRNEFARPP